MTSAAHQPSIKQPPPTDRRAYAFWLGEQHARSRRITSDAFLFLYKELVRLAGDRAYCWPGQEFLTESLDTSIGTLKRWFRELEQANLIRRVARPGGLTTLTYITAFEPREAIVADDQDEPEPDVDTPPAPLFFVPAQEIISDPNAGSNVIPHTVKTQNIKDLEKRGGGVEASCHDAVANDELDRLLQREGILDPRTANTLRTLPLEELDAVSTYLNRQTNVRSRPSLFAWLAGNRFGRSLLDGRAAKADKAESAQPSVAPKPSSGDDTAEALWEAVLREVRGEIAPDMFRTWLAPTSALLVDVEHAVLVVGTPNVFVRDEIANTYQERLEFALTHAARRPMRLELAIGM